MLSPTGRCQVFDDSGDGYVRSEGAGLFLLKDYDQAIADGDNILAVVAGSAVNTDGHKSGITVLNPSARIDLMRRPMNRAVLKPTKSTIWKATARVPPLATPMETRAIGEALGSIASPLPIGL